MNTEDAALLISERFSIPVGDALKVVEKSFAGGEFGDAISVESWLEERFFPNCVSIDEDGYARMCVDALKILSSTAATDFGGTRQRDFGQLWADMTRGYLGELAFKNLLQNKFSIGSELGHEVGSLKDFLPLDIHEVRLSSGERRQPRIGIGIKTTKWNGIWLDIPGDQFSHSDAHVMVKVGAGRDHLFAFFKALSVFKDKVLRKGEEIGALNPADSKKLFESLPEFKPIWAYVCGFVWREQTYRSLSYTGHRGHRHYTIQTWNGPMGPGDLEKIKQHEEVAGDVKFEGIGEFAHDKMYLFNTGNLRWREEEWKNLVERL